MNRNLYAIRKLRNQIFVIGCVCASLFGIAWLTAILWELVSKGIGGINIDLFTLSTPPPLMRGGLANAIVGSLILVGLATVIGTPIGVFAGTYLAEYGRYHRFAATVRILNDILLSAPSIVIGLFIYQVMVVPMGGFSGIAGAVALALIVLPVVVRQTENMLLLIPDSQREAASALGAPMSHVVHSVLWRAARTGIVTGVLLAIARISGETAPLLFTSLNNQFWSTDLDKPVASLPTMIFQFATGPYKDQHAMAWAGALVVTATVLLLSILARVLVVGERR
jgi:phosphate transport system permease protein